MTKATIKPAENLADRPARPRARGRPRLEGDSEKVIEVRKRIIEVALEEFIKYRYDDVTLAEIALRAGVNKTGFFYYFPSKVHLLYNVFDHWLGIRLRRITQLLEIESPRECLSALVRDNINMVAQYRQLCRTWVYAQPKLKDPIARRCSEKSREIMQLASGALEDCVSAGIIPPQDSRVMAEVYFAPPFSIYSWHSPDNLPPEKVANDMLAALGLQGPIR